MSEDQKPRSGPSTRFFRGFILYFLLNLLFAGQSHSAEASTSHKFITLIGSAGRDFDRVSLTLELSLNIINSSKLLESSIYSAAGLQLRHVRLTGHVASDVAILDAAASTTALAITIGSESALLARLLSQREVRLSNTTKKSTNFSAILCSRVPFSAWAHPAITNFFCS